MKIRSAIQKYGAVPCATGVMSVTFAFPAFASDAGGTGGLTSLLSTFTQVAAWM